jgi:membrane protein
MALKYGRDRGRRIAPIQRGSGGSGPHFETGSWSIDSPRVRQILSKFLADRGTHLAAMIAYFALLSFVPLLFLALSLIALAGQQSESSYLIEELRRSFPASSVDRLVEVVHAIQEQATSLSIIGGVGLLWAALGFFSVLESAFNIVYGLPNRSFVRQKLLVLLLVAASLVVLFVALVVASVGVKLTKDAGVAGGVLSYVYALAVSTALIFGFLWSLYNLLTNAALTWRETLPGAVFAAVLLQASFQILPLFVRLTSGELVALQAFGGLAFLLFWLYLMANILVLGAEVNWWLPRGRAQAAAA